MIDRKKLKYNARQIMGEARPRAVWVTLMVFGILLVLQVLSLGVNGDLAAYKAMAANIAASGGAALLRSSGQGALSLLQSSGTDSIAGWLLSLAISLMSIVISTGYLLYTLRLSRRQNPGFGDVFDAFGIFFRAVWLRIGKVALTALWTMVLAIPLSVVAALLMTIAGYGDEELVSGTSLVLEIAEYAASIVIMVVVSYRYRLAEYIMLDNPGYPCFQCLLLSRAAMKGRKWELFRLDLSFILWWLLCLIPFAELWVRPYAGVVRAEWYDGVMPAFMEELRNRPVQEPRRFDPSAMGWHVPSEERDEEWEQEDPEESDDEEPRE